jgi:DNA polymerase-3 subunit beta
MKKFIVSSGLLQRKLNVAKLLDKNTTMPILHDVLFRYSNGALLVTVSELDNQYTAEIDAEGDHDVSFTVPMHNLVSLLKLIEEQPLVFSLKGGVVTIQSDIGEYQMPSEDPSDFPLIEVDDKTQTIEFNVSDFEKWFIDGLKFVSSDEARPNLCGIHFSGSNGKYRTVATDGHKLFKCSIHSDDAVIFDCVIPDRAIKMVEAAFKADQTILIQEAGVNVVFSGTDWFLIARKIDEKYPNVDSVIRNANPVYFTVNRKELISSIKRIKGFTADALILKYRMGVLQVLGENDNAATKGADRMSVPGEGDIKIGFNPDNLLIGLNTIAQDYIKLGFETAERAVHFLDDERLLLVQPMLIRR